MLCLQPTLGAHGGKDPSTWAKNGERKRRIWKGFKETMTLKMGLEDCEGLDLVEEKTTTCVPEDL